MFLEKKIEASSIAEVVIAVAVIGLCFGIASLIFVRSTMVATSFENTRIQTEIQSQLWEELHDVSNEFDQEGLQIVDETDEANDSLIVTSFIAPDNRTIWRQHRLKYE